MSNAQHNNRVLGRSGARDLALDELGRRRVHHSKMTFDPDAGEFDQLRVD